MSKTSAPSKGYGSIRHELDEEEAPLLNNNSGNKNNGHPKRRVCSSTFVLITVIVAALIASLLAVFSYPTLSGSTSNVNLVVTYFHSSVFSTPTKSSYYNFKILTKLTYPLAIFVQAQLPAPGVYHPP